jgi:hypothetical protein
MNAGRIPLTITQFMGIPALSNNEVTAYWFMKAAAEAGLDPWRMIEGFDTHVNGTEVDVWLVNGHCITINKPAEQIIFISQKDYCEHVINKDFVNGLLKESDHGPTS